jgi:hypothetical protein
MWASFDDYSFMGRLIALICMRRCYQLPSHAERCINSTPLKHCRSDTRSGPGVVLIAMTRLLI